MDAPLVDYVPAEGADSIVAALAALIGSQYPVRVDGDVHHDKNWIRWAQGCGWIDDNE